IKDDRSRLLLIDPYLTDSVERAHAFKRLTPKLLAPDALAPDILVASHEHLDHFDIDAVPSLMADPKTILVASVTVAGLALGMGIDRRRVVAMKPGDETEVAGFFLRALPADHGALSPDALGFLLAVGATRIYFAGDTACSPHVVSAAREARPDVAIVPINGQFGNLDGKQAASLVLASGARIAVPCHFWTFMIHGGDPQEFADEMKKQAPGCELRFLHQGEGFLAGPKEGRP
ncbi:MAG: MBL fold metallo-hydrolase, partial [Spirochaetota bacterium]